MDSASVSCTPPEIIEAANSATLNLLPGKSREKYENVYKRFMGYRQSKNTESFSENVVLAYFAELSKTLKSSTMWSHYSMLRSTLLVKENVNLAEYKKLNAFLKRKSDGYKPKKSKILTKEQVDQFISEAPDDSFLTTKVALIFGIAGACRRDELVRMNVNDIEDLGSKLLVKIPDNKTNKPRSFIVNETYLEVYRKYTALRPTDYINSRFFFKITNGKSWKQPVGIHKFGKMPETVATYLKLPNVKEYTGHCFRRSSATILVDAGGDLTSLKRHGGWKSSSIAEGYIVESISNKIEVASRIFNKTDMNIDLNNIDVTSSTIANNIQPLFNICKNCTINVNITN